MTTTTAAASTQRLLGKHQREYGVKLSVRVGDDAKRSTHYNWEKVIIRVPQV